jgi:sugar/nucleoside kinase (ribokinase family)
MGRPAILFVGNATHDSVYFVPHVPRNDEVCAVRKTLSCLGGRGVVPAIVSSALGLTSELCTVIGADVRSPFEEFLTSHEIGTGAVKWDSTGRSTTQYVAFVGEATGEVSAVAANPSLDWHPTAQQSDAIKRAAAIYFSTNDLDFNAALLTEADPKNQIVVHNLGVRIEGRPAYVELILSKAAIVIGNEVEIERLSRVASAEPAELVADSESVEALVVTRGARGVLVFKKGQHGADEYAGRRAASVVSPIGAGDALAAGILASLVAGRSMEEAVALGIELGALAVESELPYPDPARVAGRL